VPKAAKEEDLGWVGTKIAEIGQGAPLFHFISAGEKEADIGPFFDAGESHVELLVIEIAALGLVVGKSYDDPG